MPAENLDLLIKGGLVFDGTGAAPYPSDIGISQGKIAFVGEVSEGAEKTLDASGLSVSPGFVDAHGHSEFALLSDPRAEGKALQGVSTEINGNCGLSAAPLKGEALAQRENDLREFDIKERWTDFKEYFGLLERRGPALNFATLAGHGNIRASALGFKNRPPDAKEMQEMKTLLRESASAGAIGMSTGLIYPPGAFSDVRELSELVCGINGLLYATHMRSEGGGLIEAIEETIEIGRRAGIKTHISHLKTSGRENWGKIGKALDIIEAGRAEGIRITCDRYPYTASSTDLDAVLPSWTYEGGAQEELKRLSDPKIREEIKASIQALHPGEEYWRGIQIASVGSEENRWMEGKDILHISEETGKKPIEAVLYILSAERLRASAIFHGMSEENLRIILSKPFVMLGSDSASRSTDGPTRRGRPHPRGFGSFPRFLGRYVREESLMSLSEAIRKITLLPCETFGLALRGKIKAGHFADIAVFDPEGIKDRATYEEPFVRPEGIRHLLVNGVPVVSEGLLTGERPGKVLRHGR